MLPCIHGNKDVAKNKMYPRSYIIQMLFRHFFLWYRERLSGVDYSVCGSQNYRNHEMVIKNIKFFISKMKW